MSMLYYVERGFEDNLIKNLERYRSVGILGLAGMGKTTTARFIYVKLKRKGVNVVYLTSDESKNVEFNISKDDREVVRCVSLRQVWREKKKDEVIALTHAVVKAIEGSIAGRLRKRARGALEWIVKKFSGKEIEKIEHLEHINLKVSIGMGEIGEVVDKFYEWFEDVFGERIVGVLGGVGKVKHWIRRFFDHAKGVEANTLGLLFELVAFCDGWVGYRFDCKVCCGFA